MTKLFEAYDLGDHRLANRVVMAPMTRARAVDEVADDLTTLYYRQRAGAGLIVTEGIPVSEEARGYLYLPGLYTDAQQDGWARVTEAVDAEGGRIFAQLWHVGRISHPTLQPNGGDPVGPTDEQATDATAFTYDADGKPGPVPVSKPRALSTEEVGRVTADFVRAARRAIDAGFDGVEIHGANAYIFEQFINGALNDRTDRYGGSIENRLRFLIETIDAVGAEIGMERVGVRILPFGRVYDMKPFADEAETWLQAAAALQERPLAYVHLSEQLTTRPEAVPKGFADAFRETYRGTLIAAGGFDKASAEAALRNGEVDLVAVGRPFIANPDLVDRWRHDRPLAEADRDTYYGPSGTSGYTDYPTWSDERS